MVFSCARRLDHGAVAPRGTAGTGSEVRRLDLLISPSRLTARPNPRNRYTGDFLRHYIKIDPAGASSVSYRAQSPQEALLAESFVQLERPTTKGAGASLRTTA